MNARGQMVGAAAQGAALSGYATDSAARQPEVVSEMERLQKAVEVIGCTAEALAARLTPVRSQVGNGVGKDPSTVAPDAVLCGMAEAVRGERRRIEGVQSVLQQALNELEI